MSLMPLGKDPTPTLPGLIAYIQTVAEREKAMLARELHDELGGMLVAASMDLAWLEQHIASPAADVQRRLGRLRDTLGGAVDLKRKIIEELRPTLLDNVGLFAALRWLVGNSCARGSLNCQVRFPDIEPHFTPDASIALFRVAQEALAIIMESKWVRALTLCINGTEHVVTLSIAGTGPPSAAGGEAERETYELATIRHRMAALGGAVSFVPAPGEVRLSAWIPRENSLVS
ncbi:MAG TPA: histidine kinase [Steroidobacteraceae bacterium]|nr:histidine kinase [Steroidobacteraceae bacterium]